MIPYLGLLVTTLCCIEGQSIVEPVIPTLHVVPITKMLNRAGEEHEFVKTKALDHYTKNTEFIENIDTHFMHSERHNFSSNFICYVEEKMKEKFGNETDYALYFAPLMVVSGNFHHVEGSSTVKLHSRNVIFDPTAPFVVYRYSEPVQSVFREAQEVAPHYHEAIAYIDRLRTSGEELDVDRLKALFGAEHLQNKDMALIVSYLPIQTCQEEKPERRIDHTEFKIRKDLYITLVRVVR